MKSNMKAKPKYSIKNMSRDELSLLILFEWAMVDNSGMVQGVKLNEQDHDIARQWNEEGFVKFGRIKFNDIDRSNPSPFSLNTHYVSLSDEAWKLAHQERKERSNRILDNRPKYQQWIKENR